MRNEVLVQRAERGAWHVDALMELRVGQGLGAASPPCLV